MRNNGSKNFDHRVGLEHIFNRIIKHLLFYGHFERTGEKIIQKEMGSPREKKNG